MNRKTSLQNYVFSRIQKTVKNYFQNGKSYFNNITIVALLRGEAQCFFVKI